MFHSKVSAWLLGAAVVALLGGFGGLGTGGVQLALADHQIGEEAGVVGGACGGCKFQECAAGNAFFEYACQIRTSAPRPPEYHKKVASGNTVAICDSAKTGGCNFGETEKVCFTVYLCGDDNTCTDCSEDPYYVPDTCTADE